MPPAGTLDGSIPPPALSPGRPAGQTGHDGTGDLLRTPYDRGEQVRALTAPVQLVHGHADSTPPTHAAESSRDAGWDGSGRPASRLAVLPGRTHHDICSAPELSTVVAASLTS